MPPARPSRARRRAWPQRLLLVVGSVIVLACVGTAAVAGYVGFRFGQIDRVGDLELQGTVAGEPANYLLVGTDSREGLDPADPDSGGFLGDEGCDCTDTIMVLRLDPDAGTASLLSFPRDLFIPIAGTGDTARINTAHAKGVQVLIDTIQKNFGVPINHYVEIDFVGFEELVDAVGGVPMWFDAPVRDANTGLSIPVAKCQVLDGVQARRFVRSRHLQYQDADGDWHADGTADLGRITRQQIFIRRAVAKAVGEGLTNPITLNDLVSAGVSNVSLDGGLTAGDLLGIGRAFASFDADQLLSYAIPSEPHTTSAGAKVELPLMRQAEPILNIFRGLPADAISPQAVDLTVLNGSGIDGQARDAAGALQEIGFNIAAIDSNAEPVTRTTVLFGDGGEAAARLVARHVTGGAALVHDPEVATGAAVLIVGADFTTVHDQPAPEGSPEDLLITTSTSPGTDGGETTSTTVPETTTTTARGYATGEPPPGVSC